MISDRSCQTSHYPAASWYCPLEIHERNLAAAFQSIPLPYDFHQVVELVRARVNLDHASNYKPQFFEEKIIPELSKLSPSEKYGANALRRSSGALINPISEIEKGIALILLCKSDRTKPLANLASEIQACCERAVSGAQVLSACQKQYSSDREVGGKRRHQQHAQVKVVFLCLLEVNSLQPKGTWPSLARELLAPLRARLRFVHNPLADKDPEGLEATLVRWLRTDPVVRAAYCRIVGGSIEPKKLRRERALPEVRPERIEDHFFGMRKRYGPD